jgi:hypothetical protein
MALPQVLEACWKMPAVKKLQRPFNVGRDGSRLAASRELWRGWLYRRSTSATWHYLLMTALLLGVLVYQSNLGGSMSYGSVDQPSPEHHRAAPSSTSAPGE